MPMSRREFTSSVAAGVATFHIVPRHVLGMGYTAPSDLLNVACIGVGGMGKEDVKGVAATGENLYAFCDVDLHAAEESFAKYPKAKQYRDYREMLDREAGSIDAVTVTIPDHGHGVAAMAALKTGKHVYCQKPLARTLHEVRALGTEAKSRPGQKTQMGNQGHTMEGTGRIREWVEAGAIGTVQEVHYWTNRPIWPQGINRPYEAYNVPPWMEWDLWLGPAPETTELYDETAPRSSRVTYDFPARGGRGPITVVWRDGGLWPQRPDSMAAEAAWPPAQIGGQMWVGTDGVLLADIYGEDPRLLDPKRDAEIRADRRPTRPSTATRAH